MLFPSLWCALTCSVHVKCLSESFFSSPSLALPSLPCSLAPFRFRNPTGANTHIVLPNGKSAHLIVAIAEISELEKGWMDVRIQHVVAKAAKRADNTKNEIMEGKAKRLSVNPVTGSIGTSPSVSGRATPTAGELACGCLGLSVCLSGLFGLSSCFL